MSPLAADPVAAERAAGDELRGALRRRLTSTDRRLRLLRLLETLVWLGPAASLWALSTWLLRLAAADGGVGFGALWPSWAGGVVLLALALRAVLAMGRDLPAAARALDDAGDLEDATTTALELGQRLDDPDNAPLLPWATLVLRRANSGLQRVGPRQAVPELVPRGAAAACAASAMLLAPVALPSSFVGEALAAVVSGERADNVGDSRMSSATTLEEAPERRAGIPELQANLSDLPLLTLRVREAGDEDARQRPGETGEGADGTPGENRSDEVTENAGQSGEPAAGGEPGEEAAETGADLMRELEDGEAAGGGEEMSAPETSGAGEVDPDAETVSGEGGAGQPAEDGAEGEPGVGVAVSEEPGSSSADADGATAGVGTGPQDEMVDPFGDELLPTFSLEHALETALLESNREIERRPLTVTNATRFREAEVEMRQAAGLQIPAANNEAIDGNELPPARHPIAWRHRDAVTRYLEALEVEPEEDVE